MPALLMSMNARGLHLNGVPPNSGKQVRLDPAGIDNYIITTNDTVRRSQTIVCVKVDKGDLCIYDVAIVSGSVFRVLLINVSVMARKTF